MNMKYLLAALTLLAPATLAETPTETENWSVIHDISHLAMPEDHAVSTTVPPLSLDPHAGNEIPQEPEAQITETTVTETVTVTETISPTGTPVVPEEITTAPAETTETAIITETSSTVTLTEAGPGEPVSTTIRTQTVEAPLSTTIPSNHIAHSPAPQTQQHKPVLKGVDNASTRTFLTGMATMHQALDITYTGDADIDYLRNMIAQHEGAIATARTVMEYGRDAQTRRFAKNSIRTRTAEINTLQKWLTNLEKRGVRISSDMPRSGQWTDENWVGEDWLNER